MSDLGMRVSQEGIDVKTGENQDMVFTSMLSIFKGSIKGSGTISVERDGTPATATIPHGLGYAPMVQAFFKDTDGKIFSPDVYINLPSVFLAGLTQFNAVVSSDDTNVYITFTITDL